MFYFSNIGFFKSQSPVVIPYLLDDYSSSQAAYSLEKISSTYTGDAIIVRRSSDNATQSIGFVGDYLDEASLLSFVGAGNGFVTTWYDQSGLGRNLAQSTASFQPRIVSSGVVDKLNGKPAVYFQGVADRMTTGSVFNHSAVFSTTASWLASGANRGLFQIGAVNTLGSLMYYDTAGVQKYILRAQTGGDSGYYTTSGTHVIPFGYAQSGRQEIYINDVIGADVGTATLASASNAVLTVGSLTGIIYPMLGYVQELVIWTVDYRTSRAAITQNLNNRYNAF